MKHQKTDKEIVEERINAVISWQPALVNSVIFYRAGIYFFAYHQPEAGGRLTVGTCNKYNILGKVISDVANEEILARFRAMYKIRGYRKIQDNIK